MRSAPIPNPVRPERVEGLLFLQSVAREARRKERCFDKLSISGAWVRFQVRGSTYGKAWLSSTSMPSGSKNLHPPDFTAAAPPRPGYVFTS